MNWYDRAAAQTRVALTVAVLLCIAGVLAWQTMPRQEDPTMPDYWGQIIVFFPGADAELVESQILTPVEDELAEVSDIRWLEATAYADMAVLTIELLPETDDLPATWTEVRRALERANARFPEGAQQPVLDEKLNDQESVVLAVTGSTDPLVLLDAARRLRRDLQSAPGVAKVNILADPGEQVVVELDDSAAQRVGASPTLIAHQLSGRTRMIPGGSLRVGARSVRLRPRSEFRSVEEIAATPVLLPSGNAIPLGEVATVRYGPAEPVRSLMRFNGEIAVGLGVVPRPSIDIVQFGEQVRETIARSAPGLKSVEVKEVVFQPELVGSRLNDLGRSLLMGILIVGAVLVAAMGIRLGLLVAAVVPLVAAASLGIYALGGGVLHQISIAALVIALGMLVDNAIVVAESIQWKLDNGASAADAAKQGARELAIPLAGATGTTLAAFVPMLVASGPTADFTRAIPVAIGLTLIVSYLFALFVTPALARAFLRARPASAAGRLPTMGKWLAGLGVRHPVIVLACTAVLVVSSFAGTGRVRQQFFPTSDRNQITVDIKLAEGTHLSSTDEAARRIERALLARSDVSAVTTFTGRSVPHYYYNLPLIPWSPHFAQLIVDTQSVEGVDEVMAFVRAFAKEELLDAEVIPRRLEQGPPVSAPVELRLTGRDRDKLYQAATELVGLLRTIPATRDVRHDLGPGAPMLQFVIDDATAGRHGLSRAEVAQTLYGRTRGIPIGELREQQDPVSVVVRAPAGEELPAQELPSINVAPPGGQAVPMAQVATIESDWRPSAIKHRDRKPVVTVSAQLAPHSTYSQVLAELGPRLDSWKLPEGVELQMGGDAEGSDEANAAMLKVMPFGLLLLLGVLLLEFNSFRRVAIVLVTAPLATAGVVPGLILSNQPFGFTSLLGTIALIGVVVNNAIVLLEVVDQRRKEGASWDDAILEAGSRRIRPIVLTTATTVAGLIPLAMSSSTLWPPLAFTMISGLIASTALTLVVVPALVRVLFARGAKVPSPGVLSNSLTEP